MVFLMAVNNIKKMLYVTTVFCDENDGIWKKIKYNLYAYIKLGFHVDLFYRTDGGYVIEYGFGTCETKIIPVDEKDKNLSLLALSKKIEAAYDLLYIRKPFGGACFLFMNALITSVKRHHKLCYIVMELPTYPYVKEIRTVKAFVSETLFMVSKLRYIDKIDLIVYMGNAEKEIWGRPSLKIHNGIDLLHVPALRTKQASVDNEIIFVGVARLSFWHGYDRLIKAISQYNGKYFIKFMVVGPGEEELKRLKTITTELELEDNIIFLGSQFGGKLDDVYQNAHVCVDSLGRHRSGNNINSSLKSKEYTAKGLPFMKSHIDESFVDTDFIYEVSPDENDINLESVITWYFNLPVDTPKNMRSFAERNLSWDIQCAKVNAYFFG